MRHRRSYFSLGSTKYNKLQNIISAYCSVFMQLNETNSSQQGDCAILSIFYDISIFYINVKQILKQ